MHGKLETRVGIFMLAAVGVFFYLGFKVGAFRFDRGRYNTYVLHFSDVSGLSVKADVKIAGVKVGWVEAVDLTHHCDEHKVSVDVTVLRDYALYADARGIVRQDGLLGMKFIEVIPGDSLLPRLQSGSSFAKLGSEPASVDSLVKQFGDIAESVRDVALSFKRVACDVTEGQQVGNSLDNVQMAACRLASFAEKLDRVLERNEGNIDSLLSSGQEVCRLSGQVQEGIDRVTDAVDQTVQRVSNQVDEAMQTISESSLCARDGMRDAASVVHKINSGEGLLGKLVNADGPYKDVEEVVSCCKGYLSKLEQIGFVFDSHVEWMTSRAESYCFKDAKGYFNLRLYPCENYFCLLQLVTSERGYIHRDELWSSYCDTHCRPVDPDTLILTDAEKLELTYRQRHERHRRNSVKFGAQVGRFVGDFAAVRFGLIEGFAGAGLDLAIPIPTDTLRWISTFELFDLRGWNRHNDRVPHFKWFNRLFVLNNIYAVFGADDFASRCNASAFFGLGLCFGDECTARGCRLTPYRN